MKETKSHVENANGFCYEMESRCLLLKALPRFFNPWFYLLKPANDHKAYLGELVSIK